ncbi:ergothioneine biosynthesis protein EgtB [Vulcaniibacterium thermophilum]|uniref:Ergothioneine biosynthesis protein EgtB n=1 Tax=Vulcaniibacterium thermophilum TaxID=1169913 RepID=A0A918YYT7_9GAMM|nr:ergothioneine biosynthesis protein EgtB [Vulcaniibacterium thermophilum]GHE27008.1 ergothioneine biosynthesis protein EgtB [Vulcaniibacterium thermophilum]
MSRVIEPAADSTAALAGRFARVRARTLELAAPLSAEDAMLQSMPEASPAKWHLAHTTWFFEQFVLARAPGHRPYRDGWAVLFNSYYRGAGAAHPRAQRGLLSRPTLDEVKAYRAEVDARLLEALTRDALDGEARRILLLGLHHEQQHQELLLTDVLHGLACHPGRPAYRDDLPAPASGDAVCAACAWIAFDEAVVEIGASPWPAHRGFAFDNESPRHRVLTAAFQLAARPVSNAEFRAFVEDGGYRTPSLWLSDGWETVEREGWDRPLYWQEDLESAFTLGGVRALDPHAPVCHLSYYEADAFARWAGARLPTEAEWERAATALPVQGRFAEDGVLQPQSASGSGLRQMFGDVWEWTASAYAPYPGYRPWRGTLGEYNGKFMCGQYVLRGGSCATPGDHVRASYRNFFYPRDRWQFAGLRLARGA